MPTITKVTRFTGAALVIGVLAAPSIVDAQAHPRTGSPNSDSGSAGRAQPRSSEGSGGGAPAASQPVVSTSAPRSRSGAVARPAVDQPIRTDVASRPRTPYGVAKPRTYTSIGSPYYPSYSYYRPYYPYYPYYPYPYGYGFSVGYYGSWGVPYGYGWYGWPSWSYGPHSYGPPPASGPPQDASYDNHVDTPSGSLRLRVSPRTARVYVDGALAGVVDDFDGFSKHLTLPAGQHQLEFRDDLYVSETLDIVIQADRTITERANLKKR